MEFSNITGISDAKGNVIQISLNDKVLWTKEPDVNLWNLSSRTEFKCNREGYTFYYAATGPYKTEGTTMPLDETLWWSGGRHLYDGCYYSYSSSSDVFGTLSNITENSFVLTSGNATDTFVAFPFHLNADETIKITFTRNSHVRGGYQIFNTDGTLRSYTFEGLAASSNASHTITCTASDECWFAWMVGYYDANSNVTISNIKVIKK